MHNDYLLTPEKLANGIKVGDVKKLIPSLGDKTNYVVNYRNFQLYLSLEMKLTKIHKMLKLKQSDWMKIYIDLIPKKERKLPIVLKKPFLKLMINFIYVKKMENLHKIINFRVVNNEKEYLKHVCKPIFISRKNIC